MLQIALTNLHSRDIAKKRGGGGGGGGGVMEI